MTATSIGTLATFLLDRIAEDEGLVRKVQRRSSDLVTYWAGDFDPYDDNVRLCGIKAGDHRIVIPAARVLAECEAKRQVVAIHAAHYGDCAICERPWPCDTLRTLALPYADHSEFREEWRP